MKYSVLVFTALVLLLMQPVLHSEQSGYASKTTIASGYEIQVYTYRPSACKNPSILLVFHGRNRKAEGVRDKAVDIAEHACLMVFSPHLDEDRFPNWRYHRAGVIRRGDIQPVQRWTYPVLQDLIEFARNEVGHDHAEVNLFGHSAGGQFLSRIAAYAPTFNVDHIIIANPSVHVLPDLGEPVPYGYEDLFSSRLAQEKIADYLAAPITLYQGQEDTGSKNLVTSKAAMRQGENRLERGRYAYRVAEDFASKNDLVFNWQLVEVPDVGHSSRGMLQAEALQTVLQTTLPEKAERKAVNQ